MNRSKKIYVLLGVLVAVSAVAFGVSRYEERKEQIKNSDEVVLEINSEDVTSLSWSYEDTSLAFHKDETWLYDEDEAFPVSEEKVNELLELFQSFGVSFIIEDVEDYGQYGLDDPVCTIEIGTEDETYEISLGDYSTMDEQRYVSIGDDKVYLVQNDPFESFELELKDMIQNDEVPEMDAVLEIQFEGIAEYTAVYTTENTTTYSTDDVYFVEEEGEKKPLDTDNIKTYVRTVGNLDLDEYVTYNATEEEIASCGLDDPELTVSMKYTTEDEETEEEISGTFILHISRDPQEAQEAAEKEAETEDEDTAEESEEEEEEITAYARVGDSQIIYKIDDYYYEKLIAASYDELRHQELLWADFEDIAQVDVTIDGFSYTLTAEEAEEADDDEEAENEWFYMEEKVDIDDFKTAVTSLTAAEFTDEEPEDKEEMRMKVYLNNANVSQVEIILYRYDGSNCLAVVDQVPTALLNRSSVVDLMEAVNAIVLN